MDYLIEQIFLYMLVAFLVGGFVGWFLCRQGASKKIAELEARLADRVSGTPVESIEGIGEGFGKRLRADGIDTTEKLLELCGSDEGVARVCKCVDLDENTVRNWGTMADLSRIKGLGGQWAEILRRRKSSRCVPVCERSTKKSAGLLNYLARRELRGSSKRRQNSSLCCQIVIRSDFNVLE